MLMSPEMGLLEQREILQSYVASPEQDELVIGWWNDMAPAGDIERAFGPNMKSISQLFQVLQPPKGLVYAVEDGRIWIAFWFEPVMGGTFVGVWIAPHRRSTKLALHVTLDAFEQFLDYVPVLLVTTSDERLARLHEKLGFDILGQIPKILDGGRDAWLSVLTKESLENGRKKRRARNQGA